MHVGRTQGEFVGQGHYENAENVRLAIIFNSSPLFTGDAGSDESGIRKWMAEVLFV